MNMTDEQIAAERERFISTRDSRRHPARGFGDPIVDPESCGWLARAEIALAEQEELRDWKESAMPILLDWNEVWVSLGKPGSLGSSNAKESKKEVERLRAELDLVTRERDSLLAADNELRETIKTMIDSQRSKHKEEIGVNNSPERICAQLERFRGYAKGRLRQLILDEVRAGGSSLKVREEGYLDELAQDAGCWIDDNGNEVPL